MAVSAPVRSPVSDLSVELAVIDKSLKSIPQIQDLYVSHDGSGTISVIVGLPEKNFHIERAIYDKQLQIIDTCPGIKLSLRVISLRGRQMSDMITPRPALQRV
jgi:hypothetical protein